LTYSFEILGAKHSGCYNQNATGINSKVAALTKEGSEVWAGSFDLDSPINFAVMKRLKLKYGLQSWNYCKIKIREKVARMLRILKLMLHLHC
jgi:hypothetical protein